VETSLIIRSSGRSMASVRKVNRVLVPSRLRNFRSGVSLLARSSDASYFNGFGFFILIRDLQCLVQLILNDFPSRGLHRVKGDACRLDRRSLRLESLSFAGVVIFA
jgi:hypothetical protein